MSKKRSKVLLLSIILGLSILIAGCIPEMPSADNTVEPAATPETQEMIEPEITNESEISPTEEIPGVIDLEKNVPVSIPVDIHDRPEENITEEAGPFCGDGNIDKGLGEECDIGGAKDLNGKRLPSYKDTCTGEKACTNCACVLESCEGTGIFDNDDCTDNCTGNQLCIQKAAKSRCYRCFDKCPVGNFLDDSSCDDSCGLNEHCQKDPVNTECYFCLERCPEGQYFGDGTCDGDCGGGTSCKPADQQSCYYCETA